MNENTNVRQLHCRISVASILAVIGVGIAALVQDEPATWVFVIPVAPLAVLLATGLILLVLPYLGRRHSRSVEG